MPSPFPGMDPYLEERSLWPDLHQRLITYISESLQPTIRPKYIARISERLEVTAIRKRLVPDMLLEPPYDAMVVAPQGGMLVADQPMIFESIQGERSVPYLEIIDCETSDVITVIEVLSPTDKIENGHEQYLLRQQDRSAQRVNLVEIDLLHSTRKISLAKMAEIRISADQSYSVTISRTHQRQLHSHPFSLQDRLPRCRIPLRAADPDVVLDLPTVFTHCYEVGSYDLMVDYTQEPSVTLRESELQWLDQQLQHQGLRV